MSVGVEINGVTLIPIKEAASRVSYTRDYVARLAREGKIVASQIGRQWFVDVSSLENFFVAAEVQDEIRNKELRDERKRELQTKEKFDQLDRLLLSKTRTHRVDAMGVVAATVCLGFFVGVSLYTTTQISSPALPKFITNLGQVTASLAVKNFTPALVAESLPIALPEETLLRDELVESPIFVAKSETQVLADGALGVLVFAQGKQVRSGAEVEALFSDQVEATFTSDNAGVIKYQKEDGAITEYSFVSVPPVIIDNIAKDPSE